MSDLATMRRETDEVFMELRGMLDRLPRSYWGSRCPGTRAAAASMR
jgi:hypothetical protein